MGYKLRMSAEIADWLGDLRESDPFAATEVGAALLAVMTAADVAALAFVTDTREPDSEDPRERLDRAYQRTLTVLQRFRRHSAEAATRRKELELRLSEERAAQRDGAALAKIAQMLAAARRREEVLTAQSQRLQVAVDAFRTAKETAKAMVTSAEAQRRLRDAFRAGGIEYDEPSLEAEQAAAQAETALVHADRLLDSAMVAAGLRERTPRAGTAGSGVLELQADPFGADIRIVFAIEPPGTVTLLAALEGCAVISEHRDDAIDLAGDLLAKIRDRGWSTDPEAQPVGGPEFATSAAFLAECFPSEADAVAERAAVLARAVSLRGLRGETDLGDPGMTGIFEDRLRKIDRDGLEAAGIRELAAYLRALGGRLELTAVIDGETHILAR